jgi:magnesium-transporting ATPase (P-type)
MTAASRLVVLNGAIGFFQEYSAEKTSEALQAPVPHTARVRASSLQRNVSRMARQVSAVAVAPAKLALWDCDCHMFKHCDLRGQR